MFILAVVIDNKMRFYVIELFYNIRMQVHGSYFPRFVYIINHSINLIFVSVFVQYLCRLWANVISFWLYQVYNTNCIVKGKTRTVNACGDPDLVFWFSQQKVLLLNEIIVEPPWFCVDTCFSTLSLCWPWKN